MKYLTSIGKKYRILDFSHACISRRVLMLGFGNTFCIFRCGLFCCRFYFQKRICHTSSAQEPVLETNASHDRENIISAATDKLSKLPFLTSVRVACHYADSLSLQAEQKIEEVVGAFQQFHLPQLNVL
jgi:hypothetical protein